MSAPRAAASTAALHPFFFDPVARAETPRQSSYTSRTYIVYVTTVSVRIDDAMLDEARRFQINVSEALRRGLADEIRKARVKENVARLAKVAQKPSTPSVDQLRGLRDGRRA